MYVQLHLPASAKLILQGRGLIFRKHPARDIYFHHLSSHGTSRTLHLMITWIDRQKIAGQTDKDTPVNSYIHTEPCSAPDSVAAVAPAIKGPAERAGAEGDECLRSREEIPRSITSQPHAEFIIQVQINGRKRVDTCTAKDSKPEGAQPPDHCQMPDSLLILGIQARRQRSPCIQHLEIASVCWCERVSVRGFRIHGISLFLRRQPLLLGMWRERCIWLICKPGLNRHSST